MIGRPRNGPARRALAVLVAGLAIAAAPPGAAAAPMTPLEPDAPTVAIRAERSKVLLGEPFHVTITVLHGAGVTVTLPAALPIAPFEEVGPRGEDEAQVPGRLSRHTFELTVVGFQLGKTSFPAVPITYVAGGAGRQATTEPFELEVLSVVGDGHAALKPAAPPVGITRRDLSLLWAAGIGLAALVLAAIGRRLVPRLFARGSDQAARAEIVVDLPPDEAALAQLRELLGSPLLEASDRRPLYFAATATVRGFLGVWFGFDALELTTRELLEQLARRAPQDFPHAELAAWLDVCDLVKYAGVPAGRTEALAVLDRAGAIVEASRRSRTPIVPAPSVAAPEAAPQAGAGGADGS